METMDNFQSISICSQLNLNIQDLNIQSLQHNPIYRRLYNIVSQDRNKSQYQYRKNLIKQLYFLLKLTPIIKAELQQSYLEKLEKWYNSNDHKKTELGSGRLRDLVNQYVLPKQSQNHLTGEHIRPQSGVNWNKNVNPFLRPYTAKRPLSRQQRPQSYKSKFGQSTNVSTKLQSCQQTTIREFALSIKQQFQVSQDFINKNRTIHPQSEPIYEQLFNIIKKAGVNVTLDPLSIKKQNMKGNKSELIQSQNQILFQRDRQQFFNQKPNDIIIRVSEKQQQHFLQNNQNLIPNDDQFQKVSQQSQKQQDDKKSSQQQQNTFQRKIYTRDQNLNKKHNQNDKNVVEGFHYITVENQKDVMFLKKANNKYSHITNNKFVNYSKDDHQLLRNYVNYTRVKSAMRKEFNRKSQTKRLLSAKIRSNTNSLTSLTAGQGLLNQQGLIGNKDGKVKNQRIYSALPRKNHQSIASGRKTDKSQIINSNGAKIFDLTSHIPLYNKQNAPSFITSPTHYNQRQQLDKLYRNPIQQFKKLNKNTISYAEIKCKDTNLLTKYDCFLTRQKINPIADVHIENHNQQALEEIEKIKQKISGLGKKCLSSDALMKALYINSYDDVGSCSLVNKNWDLQRNMEEKTLDEKFDWKKRNVYFNMISNGQKKMKKKTRKLHNKK